MSDQKKAGLTNAAGGDPKPAWLHLVQSQVASLRFGSVVVTVHDSRVVQVEKQEKVRLDTASGGLVS